MYFHLGKKSITIIHDSLLSMLNVLFSCIKYYSSSNKYKIINYNKGVLIYMCFYFDEKIMLHV